MDPFMQIMLYIVFPTLTAIAFGPVVWYFIAELRAWYKKQRYLGSAEHRKYVEQHEKKQH